MQADLAEAAAIALADEGRFDGPTQFLTAASACDFAGVGAMLSELTGGEIAKDGCRARAS